MNRPSLPTAGVPAVLVGAALQLYFFQRGFYSIGWDESGRTLDAWAWIRHGVIQVPEWLPLYRVVVGCTLRVFPDLVLAPRLLTNAFGLAAIPAMAWVAWEIFQDRRTATLSLAAAALFSQRIALSLAPASSIMFSVFMLLAMALFCRWLRTGRTTTLYASAVLTAVAGVERFEGWIFAAAIAAAVWLSRPRLPGRCFAVVLLILFAFPAATMVRRTVTGQNTIERIQQDSRQHSSRQVLAKNPAVEFVVTNAYCGNLLGLAVLVPLLGRAGYRRTLSIVAFAPLIVLAVGLLAAFAAQTGPSWRLIGVWSFLLVPFTAHGITLLMRRGTWGSRAALGGAALLAVLFVRDLLRIEAASSWAFPPADRRAGEYIRQLVEAEPGVKVVVKSDELSYLNVMVSSQHPDSFVLSPDLAPRADDSFILLYRTPDTTGELEGRSDMVRLAQFGAWSLFRK